MSGDRQPRLDIQLTAWLLQLCGLALLFYSAVSGDPQASQSSAAFMLGFLLVMGAGMIQMCTSHWAFWLPRPLLLGTYIALFAGLLLYGGVIYTLLPQTVTVPARGLIVLGYTGTLAASIMGHVRGNRAEAQGA